MLDKPLLDRPVLRRDGGGLLKEIDPVLPRLLVLQDRQGLQSIRACDGELQRLLKLPPGQLELLLVEICGAKINEGERLIR